MKKFLILFLVLFTILTGQEKVKEEKKEGEKETVQPANKEVGKDVKEENTYWDKENTIIKIKRSFYIKDGKEILHGPFNSYSPNGKALFERNFADGLLDGIESRYNDKGVIEHKFLWKKNQLIKETVYFLDGTKRAETELATIEVKNPDPTLPDIKKQVKTGTEILYYKSGRKRVQMIWLNDIQNGPETYWHDITPEQKKYELTWKMGKKEGIEAHWFENGKLSDSTNWIDNKAHGEMKTFHKNGAKKDLLEWDMGVLVNDRFYWNETGELIAKCTNKNGNTFEGTVFDVERLMILTFENGRQVKSAPCDKNGNIKGN